MGEVQVLQRMKAASNGRCRGGTGAVKADRIRATAYCRVSTGGDEREGNRE